MMPAWFQGFKKRIFWRIYLYSLTLLLAVVLGVAAIALLVERKTPRQGAPVRRAELTAAALLPHLPNRPQFQKHLETFQASLSMGISVYEGKGITLAAAGASPPPPLDPGEFSTLHSQRYFFRGTSLYVAVPLDPLSPEGAYLIMGELSPSGLTRIISSLLLLFLLLAVVSFPVSRTVARPLEKLTACARGLSQGDLSARTDVKREDELGQLATAVNEMAAQLEARIRREKELLGNISHEIRTPLSRIKVALELSDDEGDACRVASRLRSISADLGELDGMVEDILLAMRLDLATDTPGGDGVILRRETVDLGEVAARSAHLFSERHPEHRLRIEVPEEIPPIAGDPVFLRRTIDNLLDNAAGHSPPDREVRLSITPAGSGAAVEIHDRGKGIDGKDLPRIFEPFFRAGGATGALDGGVGLGLTLCKRIVEAHGGTIEASSHPDGGTVVRFSVSSGLAGASDLG